MKYQYFYQTSKNENRDGFLNAKNRADAYALLRKQGIRPYRLLGDDPVNWQPWAVGASFFILVAVFISIIFWQHKDISSIRKIMPRQQLVGDGNTLLNGIATNWEGVLPTRLDRYLAAYAQPGWIAIPPNFTADEIARFKEDLSQDIAFNDNDSEVVAQLKGIISSMRQEMKEYLNKGGSIEGYLVFLDERQARERELRKKAYEMVESAGKEGKEKRIQALMNQNMLLRSQGIAELESL